MEPSRMPTNHRLFLLFLLPLRNTNTANAKKSKDHLSVPNLRNLWRRRNKRRESKAQANQKAGCKEGRALQAKAIWNWDGEGGYAPLSCLPRFFVSIGMLEWSCEKRPHVLQKGLAGCLLPPQDVRQESLQSGLRILWKQCPKQSQSQSRSCCQVGFPVAHKIRL